MQAEKKDRKVEALKSAHILIKRYPNELSNSQIAKLTGSTKNTVDNIRNGTYREAVLESKSPMDIGLCTYLELEKALNRSRNRQPENKKI